MKNILTVLIGFFLVIGVYADTFDDPELRDYLDKPFVQEHKDIFVMSSYYNDYFYYGYGSDGRNCFMTMAMDYFGFSRGEAEALDVQAANFYNSTFGTDPTDNWSFVLNTDTNTIIEAYRADNYHENTNENNEIAITRDDHNNYMEHSYLTGDNITMTNAEGQTTHYHVANAVNYSPIILDIDNNGKPSVNRNVWTPHAPAFYSERTAIFDMTGDGKPEFIEWMGIQDGLLVLPDADENCPVKSAKNLFGTAGGYQNGYEKMALVLDTDKNGWVEGNELNGLCVWRDMNGNAKVDKGELVSVQEIGVEKISVDHNNFESVCYINGQKVKTWDWWPCGYELIKK